MGKETLVYLLSPVRQVTEAQSAVISSHAENLKREGARIFNPVVDAPQQDKTGFYIVMSELAFMNRAAKENGRVDILWNAGGTPSEGSRVDLGMAIALGLNFNLITIFNEEKPEGTQLGLQLIKEVSDGNSTDKPLLSSVLAELEKITSEGEAIIDWNVTLTSIEDEWQRIRLGLALGCLARHDSFKIKLGTVIGEDPVEKKSYIKVIKEIENNSI